MKKSGFVARCNTTSQITSDMINNLGRNQVNYSAAVATCNLIARFPTISIKALFICNKIARCLTSEMLWNKTATAINLLKLCRRRFRLPALRDE